MHIHFGGWWVPGTKNTRLCIAIVFTGVWILAAASQAQTSPSTATLTYPQNGATQVTPNVQFSWIPVSGAQAYYLYVGSAPGLKNSYDSGETKNTSALVSLSIGTTYYARLYTETNNTWYAAADVVFTTVTPSVLLSPSNQAIGLPNLLSFSWTAIPGSSGYYLYVGRTPGAKDVIDSGAIKTTQITKGLTGGTFYARLYTLINAQWYASTDISFSVVAPPTPSTITAPNNGSTLFNTLPVTFSWTPIQNATAYYLYVGTAPGAKDVINSGELQGTQLSRTLPVGTYYARIYSEIAQVWYASSDISLSVIGSSVLSFPPNNASNVDPYTSFAWQVFPGATAYSLSIGTAPGASDVLASGSINSTSFQVSAPLQANTSFYATLGTLENGSWVYTNSAFTTGTGIAHLLSPTDGATEVDPFSRLSWSVVKDAQAYYVYVGSAEGAKDVYDSGEVQTTALAVPDLKPMTKYFVRLYTEKQFQWYSGDYSFTTGSGIAHMVYPSDGARNVDPAIPFTWSIDPLALSYYLIVGTSPGANDVYDGGEVVGTSAVVPVSLPRTYYIRLSTHRADGWHFNDSSFTLGDYVAHLLVPSDQGVADSYAPFTWTGLADASKYYLYVGTAVGANDVFDSGELSSTSVVVQNLIQGKSYFARLFTLRSGVWDYADTTFVAGTGLATLVNPADGVSISPFQTFSWTTPDGGADAYLLKIGRSPSTADVFYSGPVQQTSIVVPGLDFASTYYVTLLTLKANVWRSYSSTFFTLDQKTIPDINQVRATFYSNVAQATAAVRAMADPNTNIAVSGTPLDIYLRENNLSLASCFQYALVLQNQLMLSGIQSRLRGITLTGTSFESHTPLEYYDPFNRKWSVADPTFGLLYFDSATQVGQSVEEIQSLVAANAFADIKFDYVTPLGGSALRSYYMDPMTLYLNVIPPDQKTLTAVQNSPLQFLEEVPPSIAVGQQGTYLFSFGDSSEQAQITSGDGGILATPIDGTSFSKAFFLASDWTLDSAPADLKIYIFVRPVF